MLLYFFPFSGLPGCMSPIVVTSPLYVGIGEPGKTNFLTLAELKGKNMTASKGGTIRLQQASQSLNPDRLKWVISDPSVGFIDQQGDFVAQSNGITNVQLEINGQLVLFTIKVLEQPQDTTKETLSIQEPPVDAIQKTQEIKEIKGGKTSLVKKNKKTLLPNQHQSLVENVPNEQVLEPKNPNETETEVEEKQDIDNPLNETETIAEQQQNIDSPLVETEKSISLEAAVKKPQPILNEDQTIKELLSIQSVSVSQTKVSNLRASTTQTSITLYWQDIFSIKVIGYNLYVDGSLVPPSGRIKRDLQTHTYSYTFKNLKPETEYTLGVSAVNQAGQTETVSDKFRTLKANAAPEIVSLFASDTILYLGAITKLTCEANDSDNTLDAGAYRWSMDNGNAGTFSSTIGPVVYWRAPTTPGGPYTIRVQVSDGNTTVEKAITITLDSSSGGVGNNGGFF